MKLCKRKLRKAACLALCTSAVAMATTQQPYMIVGAFAIAMVAAMAGCKPVE